MTTDDQSPPARPNRSIGIILSWLTIIGVVGFVAVRTFIVSHTSVVEEASDDITMLLSGRTAVGYGELIRKFAPNGIFNEPLRQISRQAIANARTPRERLCAVTIIGELEGGPAALDELNRIAPRLPSSLVPDVSSLDTIYRDWPNGLSDHERQDLEASLGWFGKLALSFHQPADAALRRQVLATAIRAFIATASFELFIFGIVLAGIALLTLVVVRLVDGRLRLAYHPPGFPPGPFLESFALYLAGYVGLGLLLHRLDWHNELAVYAIATAWVLFSCLWPLIRGLHWRQVREGFGWHAGGGVAREAVAGLTGYIAGIPLVGLATYVTLLLTKLSGEQPVHPMMFGKGPAGAGAIAGLYLLAAVWAPIVEETMFRGGLFHYLRFRHGWLFSAIISSLIFGMLHPQGWAAWPVLATIGFVFAGIRQWRGTFLASATAHAVNNAVVTTMFLVVFR